MHNGGRGGEPTQKKLKLSDNPLRAASSQGENDGPVEANNGISAINIHLDAIDPRILKDYAERSQNTTFIGHRRGPNFWIFYE
ncbi:hypothetical protein COOONC_28225 [Cooperia oncophora]